MALEGARESIARHKPVIVLELRDHAIQYGYKDDTIRDMVYAMGYRLHKRVCHDEIFLPA